MLKRRAVSAALATAVVLSMAAPGGGAAGTSPRRIPVWSENTIAARDLGLVRPISISYQQRPGRLILQATNRFGREQLVRFTPLGGERASQSIPASTIDTAYDPRARTIVALRRVKVTRPADVSPATDVSPAADQPQTSRTETALAVFTGRQVTSAAGEGTLTTLDPELTRDIAIDAAGRLYALEGRDIVRVRPGALAPGRAKERVMRIGGALGSAADAIVIGPQDGRFWALDRQAAKLYRLTGAGQADRVVNLAAAGVRSPRAAVFAPSADPTDRPGELSLYVADAGRRSAGRPVGAGVKELTFVRPASVRSGLRPAAVFGVTLLGVIRTSDWDPPSPDPMGIEYVGDIDRLVVTDSEVEENHPLFVGSNGFRATTAGVAGGTFDTLPWNNEPAGLAYDGGPNGPRYFVANDSKKLIWEVQPGGDGIFWTADDARRSFNAGSVGSIDPEGLGWGAGNLLIADGTAKEVIVVDPVNGDFFDGVSVRSFDVEGFGISDSEGIDYAPDRDSVLVVSRKGASMVETTLGGQLIAGYSLAGIDIVSPSGLAYGPRSDGAAGNAVYISARGIDNNDDPNENDGKIFELALGGSEPLVVQLANRSFEHDADGDGRPDAWTQNAAFTRSNANVVAGDFAGRHQSTADAGYTIRQDVPGISTGQAYRFSGQVDAQTGADRYTFKARVIWRSATDANISTVTVLQLRNAATSGWQSFSQDLVAPAGAVTARVLMTVSSLNGTVWVDDFSFAAP